MSDVPAQLAPAPSPGSTTRAALAGRWQIPLMMAALALLGYALWQLRPEPVKVSFDEQLTRCVGLKEAGLFGQASEAVEALMADPQRPPEQLRRLHRLMAEVISGYEAGNSVHGSTNCRKILSNLDKSMPEGAEPDLQARRMRATAYEWLGQTRQSIPEYQALLAAGVPDAWPLRRHVLELRRLHEQITPAEIEQEFGAFVEAEDCPVDLRHWAAEGIISLLGSQSRHQEAEQFLAKHETQFRQGSWGRRFEYLQALVWHQVGRSADSERLLRTIRDQLVPGDAMYAEAGWLLGTVILQQGAPEVAMSLFDDVIATTVPSPWRTGCLLGRAEALSDLDRFEESIADYQEVIRLAGEESYGSRVDLQVVRESMTRWYQALSTAGRNREALGYLRPAAHLAPPADKALQLTYARWLGDLCFELGSAARESGLARASEATTQPADQPQDTRAYFAEAGDCYLRIARQSVDDVNASTEANWLAAEAFDLGGDRRRMIDVLEGFIRERPDHPRVPEALLQLGRAYHADADLPTAIQRYQRNLIDFPRTRSALACLIPLADCFVESGRTDLAEQTLLRMVARRPNEALAPVTPEADEYRDGLFRLAQLYVAAGEYEKAITRLEEALERYAEDPRADEATFQLADAYRRSAARIRADLDDPRNAAHRESLQQARQERLERAAALFGQVIDRYAKRQGDSLGELDKMYAKLGHFYMADAVYDQSQAGDARGLEPCARALELYEKAAWAYQRDPLAMSGYVQIVNCYLRLGKVPEAWMAIQRARWVLRNIPEDRFPSAAEDQTRAWWDDYLTWLERKPTFEGLSLAKAG